MTNPQPLPPVEFLQECFRYDPETGALYWRHRPDHHFSTALRATQWNSRHSGSPALRTFAVRSDGSHKTLRGEFIYGGRRFRVSAHRVIFKLMTGEEPEMVDHKNCDSLDNRWANLRAATAVTNRQNNRGRKTVLPKCVSFEKGRFRAIGGVGAKNISLGSYGSPAEAHAAWCAWAKPLHGEFFNPGPPSASVFD